jgi:hypothetical protein
MEGSGFDQQYQLPGTGRPGAAARRRIGVVRLLAVAVLATLGVSCLVGAATGLSITASRAESLIREAGPTELTQRFAFDRRAWQALAVDDLFPPNYQSTTAAPTLGLERDFTRIGVAPRTSCSSAFDPALVRLLSAHACGPVLRAGYTDASRSLVATVGVAFLGTSPDAQRAVNAATESQHDDLRPRALALPGTPAATFGDAQRLAFRVFGDSGAPFLTFSVVGFSDGRPAAADTGPEALNQSGARLTAIDLEDMVDKRIAQATDALWTRSQG